MDGSHRAEQLHLLVAHGLGAEVARRLHAHDGHQLHDVVLDDVAQRAGLLVVRAATLDADVLGDGDLHVVDVLPVPQRLEDAVGKAEDEQVLHRLLAEVVVDAVDLLLVEGGVQLVVEVAGALQVVSERFLHHHACVAATVGLRQPLRAEALRERREPARRDREVEDAVAGGAALAVELVEGLVDRLQAVLGVEVEGAVPQAVCKDVPDVIPQGHAAVLRDARTHRLTELLGGLLGAPGADDAEAGRQLAVGGQCVERRNQLALGEITGGAEDHHHARQRDAALAKPLAERVGASRGLDGDLGLDVRVGHGCVDAGGAWSSLFTAWPPNSLRRAAITLLPKPSGWRDW